MSKLKESQDKITSNHQFITLVDSLSVADKQINGR